LKKIELGFGSSQYAALAAAGLFGTIPLTVLLASVFIPLLEGGQSSGGSTAGAAVGLVAGVALVFGPPILPCLVLRARQPRGARITWDDEEIVLWDGPWKRTAIPWDRVTGDRAKWKIGGFRNLVTQEALALRDRTTDARIHVWTERPNGAPLVRDRLCARDLRDLSTALDEKKIVLGEAPDWSRAADPARVRRSWLVWLGRLGYVFAFAMIIPPEPGLAKTAIGSIATVLLALRTAPPVMELLATRSPARAPEHAAAPYREAERPEAPTDEAGRAAADGARRRAVLAEAVVRAALVVLCLASLRAR
jgi:hypothetical protein